MAQIDPQQASVMSRTIATLAPIRPKRVGISRNDPIRQAHGFDWKALAVSTGKIIVCSLVMIATLHWIGALGAKPDPTLLSRAWYLFGQMAIGGLSFIATARILNVEELALTWQTIVMKFERNLITPPENREAPIA